MSALQKGRRLKTACPDPRWGRNTLLRERREIPVACRAPRDTHLTHPQKRLSFEDSCLDISAAVSNCCLDLGDRCFQRSTWQARDRQAGSRDPAHSGARLYLQTNDTAASARTRAACDRVFPGRACRCCTSRSEAQHRGGRQWGQTRPQSRGEQRGPPTALQFGCRRARPFASLDPVSRPQKQRIHREQTGCSGGTAESRPCSSSSL